MIDQAEISCVRCRLKSYPIRWLIVLVSTVAALFLAIIVIMVMEKISAYNAHKKFQLGQS